jgi:hypothetical protein
MKKAALPTSHPWQPRSMRAHLTGMAPTFARGTEVNGSVSHGERECVRRECVRGERLAALLRETVSLSRLEAAVRSDFLIHNFA